MSVSTHKQTLAFFGATGGVCNAALAHALQAGHTCTALARTPQKLIDMIRTAHNISLETIESHLTIHTGDIKDVSAVSSALRDPHDTSKLVDSIIFGIGGYPVFKWSVWQPITLNDVHICEDGTLTIFRALEALASEGVAVTSQGTKPLFISISTTGISDKRRDVPLLLYPLYHYTLHVPHLDKKKAEQLLVKDDGRHIRDCVIIRPTLLTDAAPAGVEKLRVGWEWKDEDVEKSGVREAGPQLGWSVGRKDVGAFVFKKAVQEGNWDGRCVSLTN